MFQNPIIVGILGGVASALLFLGAAKGSGLAIPLLIFSPMPVLLVAFGWLPLASVLATLALIITLSIATTPMVGGIAALIIAVPVLVAAYWHTLSRPAHEIGGPSGTQAWYPIPYTFAHALIVFSIAFIIVGILTGFQQDNFEHLMRSILNEVLKAGAASPQRADVLAQISPENLDILARRIAVWLPISMGGTWVAILALNFFLADKLSRASGRFLRPEPDFARELAIAPQYVGVFAVGALLFSMSGNFSALGGVIAGIFGMGFVLVGLAVIHYITRGMVGRPLLLAAAYIPLVIFGLPALLFLALGIVETLFGLRRRAGPEIKPTN